MCRFITLAREPLVTCERSCTDASLMCQPISDTYTEVWQHRCSCQRKRISPERLKLHTTDFLWCAAQSGASQFKTSVVFSVPEGPGQLFKALSVFALRELDISKIESRPMRSKPMQPFVGAGRASLSMP